MSEPRNLYERAGVNDVREFYRTKFISDEVLDERYFKPLDRFDLRFARTMWIYDNVRAGSSVLDLGCGSGMLALLRRKDVVLSGVDLSEEGAAAARRNGYDFSCEAELSNLPFPDARFDYVVSLDVLGHISAENKDAVLQEIKRVLRPGGVTMHGIECTDRSAQKAYDEMTPEELRKFIAIDGHVGLEEDHEHAARLEKFFPFVDWEPRYTLCLSSEEFLKQADQYGLPFESDFIDYLRGLSFKERRAFDMAMGYVFGKISDLHISLPTSGLYVFMKASDAPLGPFYNEHRDRRELYPFQPSADEENYFCLDRNRNAAFDDGWFEPNLIPPIARWMGRKARITFEAEQLSELTFDLVTHMTELATKPLGIEIFLDGEKVCAFSLFVANSWLPMKIFVPQAAPSGKHVVEIHADRTWQPRPVSNETRDDRELSVAVCNIEVIQE
jgi:cyclopropane fatty-acyl-phospholipid synthase-like methyltransferase